MLYTNSRIRSRLCPKPSPRENDFRNTLCAPTIRFLSPTWVFSYGSLSVSYFFGMRSRIFVGTHEHLVWIAVLRLRVKRFRAHVGFLLKSSRQLTDKSIQVERKVTRYLFRQLWNLKINFIKKKNDSTRLKANDS